MKELIRLVVLQGDRSRTAAAYLSIVIAYLEEYNWQRAYRFLKILENMTLLQDESLALAYLSILWEYQDKKQIVLLSKHLGDS